MATQSELAKHLDLSTRSIRDLIDEGVIAKAEPGQYDLDAARIAYIRKLRGSASGRAGSAGGGDNRDRLTAAQADKAELELAMMRRDLIPAEEVEAALIDATTNMKVRLLALPSTIAPLVNPETPAEAEKLIRDKVNDALEEIANVDVYPETEAPDK